MCDSRSPIRLWVWQSRWKDQTQSSCRQSVRWVSPLHHSREQHRQQRSGTCTAAAKERNQLHPCRSARMYPCRGCPSRKCTPYKKYNSSIHKISSNTLALFNLQLLHSHVRQVVAVSSRKVGGIISAVGTASSVASATWAASSSTSASSTTSAAARIIAFYKETKLVT